MKFSSLNIHLPDAQGVSLLDLPSYESPFVLYLDHLDPNDMVKEFGGVIGQNHDLVATGSFVLLSTVHHEVASYTIM